MKLKYLFALLLAAALTGCTTHSCKISCGGVAYIVLVGFTHADVAGSTLASFDNYTFTGAPYLQNTDTLWAYPTPTDTTSDTLIFDGIGVIGNESYSFEVILPVLNDTYKISNIASIGAFQYHTCTNGQNTNTLCDRPGATMTSYTLNGTLVTPSLSSGYNRSNPGHVAGYIYIVK